jgi:hypothetical protein
MTDNILSTLSASADAPTGTYVGANVSPFTADHRELFSAIKGLSGSKIGSSKLHTTVIYSKQYVDPALLEPAIGLYKTPIRAKLIGAAAFDALPDPDDSRAADVAALVIKLECPELMQLHAACKDLGCTHTYPELSPHVSLFYGVPKADCHAAVDKLNAAITALQEPVYVELTKLYVEPIKPDWAVKNTTAK